MPVVSKLIILQSTDFNEIFRTARKEDAHCGVILTLHNDSVQIYRCLAISDVSLDADTHFM